MSGYYALHADSSLQGFFGSAREPNPPSRQKLSTALCPAQSLVPLSLSLSLSAFLITVSYRPLFIHTPLTRMIQGGRLGRLGPGQAGERAPAPELLSVAFNQDGSMFSAAMADGFRIYASDPPVQRAGHGKQAARPRTPGRVPSRPVSDTPIVFGRHGGIGMATMLGRSNLLALVGGGKAPQYPCNKVQLWDDTRGRIVAEAELRRDVKRVCISRER